MVRLFSEYENVHQLQKHHFNTPPTTLPTITTVNQRFNKTGSVEDLQRTSCPETVLTEERI